MKLQYPFIAFYAIIRACNPKAVCDIGSKDGKESKRFRRLLSPKARIFAFEANPDNYTAMLQDQDLVDTEIELSNMAVSNTCATASFYLVDSEGPTDPKSGASSLMVRPEFQGRKVEVDTITLDGFLLQQPEAFESLCLWIDVEGHGYEVLEGAVETLRSTIAIHIEVEEKALWNGQNLVGDVRAFLQKHGFDLYCEPSEVNFPQYNLVFINRNFFQKWTWLMKFRFAAYRSIFLAFHWARFRLT